MRRPTSNTSLSRRDFVGTAATIAAAAAIPGQRASAQRAPLMRATEPFAIEERSIADLSAAMQSGQLSAHAITQQYLDRIASLDHQGPSLHYVI
ncbi:MAG: twin-arginine translocation signal domain-containing protein, partial [Polaromonas sp.]|nr:twin-arginine translocation signal domain-containing protein [Gemmatimonadaceae bacterium]